MEKIKKHRWTLAATATTLVVAFIVLVGCDRSGTLPQPLSTISNSNNQATRLPITGEPKATGTTTTTVGRAGESKDEPGRSPPTQELTISTLTPTSTPPRVSSSVPNLPVIQLRYAGKVYSGLPGSGCWPRWESDGSLGRLCWDTGFLDPLDTISVAAGDVLIAEIEAHERPVKLGALVYTSAGESPWQNITLIPDLTAPFTTNFPVGVYIIHIFGAWSEGDVYYAFKIDVS